MPNHQNRLKMKLEDSPYIKNCFVKFYEPFGDFYIFEKFVVSEIAEGAHFDWEKANILIGRVNEYFGTKNTELSYISNRINSYSVTAQDWLKFYSERNSVACVAVVAYEEKGLLSVQLEKIFTKSNYQTFASLDDAMHWLT